MTPYDPATIRRLADTGDAFWKGAAWMLDQLTEPSPSAGVSSCPTRRKDTP